MHLVYKVHPHKLVLNVFRINSHQYSTVMISNYKQSLFFIKIIIIHENYNVSQFLLNILLIILSNDIYLSRISTGAFTKIICYKIIGIEKINIVIFIHIR